MPFLLRDKTDIKIFILYLLMHIEHPVDFVTLHDLVVQDGFVKRRRSANPRRTARNTILSRKAGSPPRKRFKATFCAPSVKRRFAPPDGCCLSRIREKKVTARLFPLQTGNSVFSVSVEIGTAFICRRLSS